MFPPHLWTVGPRVHWLLVPGPGGAGRQCEEALILEASQLKELVYLEVWGGTWQRGGTKEWGPQWPQAPLHILSPTAGSSFLDSQESAQCRALGSDCHLGT